MRTRKYLLWNDPSRVWYLLILSYNSNLFCHAPHPRIQTLCFCWFPFDLNFTPLIPCSWPQATKGLGLFHCSSPPTIPDLYISALAMWLCCAFIWVPHFATHCFWPRVRSVLAWAIAVLFNGHWAFSPLVLWIGSVSQWVLGGAPSKDNQVIFYICQHLPFDGPIRDCKVLADSSP